MSKLRVITYANGRYLALDGRVMSVSIKGDTASAFRTAEVNLINASNMRESVLTFGNGKELRVLYDNVEVFRGILFQHSTSSDGKTKLTAHDYNVYLVKNSDSVVYRDQTATTIIKDLCGKFGIPVGSLANTGYILKKHLVRGATLYDIMLQALHETEKQTGKIYRLRNRNGQVELTDVTSVTSVVLLADGNNIMSGDYSESIEDLRSVVKLTGGDEDKPIEARVSDSGAKSTYGTMQHYEHLSDVKRSSELQSKARSMLAELSKPKQSYQIKALGNTGVMSGTAVGVLQSMTKINGTFTVEADTHSFAASGLYTMDLTLTKFTK